MKLSRSTFICGAVALGAECVMGANAAPNAGNAARLKVRFLGTGAADWNGRDARLLYATDTAGIPAEASRLAGLEWLMPCESWPRLGDIGLR